MNFEENFTKETIFNISYTKFEEFIKFNYGIDFSFLDSDWNNACVSGRDSCQNYIIKKQKLRDYQQNMLNCFLEHNKPNMVTHIILTDLCNKGIISEGKYIIDVCY